MAFTMEQEYCDCCGEPLEAGQIGLCDICQPEEDAETAADLIEETSPAADAARKAGWYHDADNGEWRKADLDASDGYLYAATAEHAIEMEEHHAARA